LVEGEPERTESSWVLAERGDAMFGVALLFFGYVAPGIVILVISAVVALGFIASHRRDPGGTHVRVALAGEASTGGPRSRPEGTATAITAAEETSASTEVVAETAAVAGEVRANSMG
jgi:hypothetical protein